MLLIDESTGKQIAYYRKNKKLTQRELAIIVGIPGKYLSDIETGRKVPRINHLARIAAALGVTMDELTGGNK